MGMVTRVNVEWDLNRRMVSLGAWVSKWVETECEERE